MKMPRFRSRSSIAALAAACITSVIGCGSVQRSTFSDAEQDGAAVDVSTSFVDAAQTTDVAPVDLAAETAAPDVSTAGCVSVKGVSCGSCGGKVQCDGSCSITAPVTFGQACGSCGGTVQCSGACSVPTPPMLGKACGSCAGKILCDGSCSTVTPPNFGAACGSCGGSVLCDGSCNIPTPTNLGAACGSCGGKIQCNGTCSVPDPPGLNTACGSCGGTLTCSGQCSVPTPSDFGAVMTVSISDNFTCCGINETRSYGPSGFNTNGCFSGYSYGGCSVVRTGGGGSVSVVSEDPKSCTCQVHINNNGLDGAGYTVSIRQIRGC